MTKRTEFSLVNCGAWGECSEFITKFNQPIEAVDSQELLEAYAEECGEWALEAYQEIHRQPGLVVFMGMDDENGVPAFLLCNEES